VRAVPKTQLRTPVLPLAWIGICVFCSCAGWILSAFHWLTIPGYLVFACVSVGVLWLFRDVLPGARDVRAALRWPRRRFRRLFPLGFLILAGLALLGGVIYAPNNYDALAYRTPRVLHWLAEHRWHWIHTDFGRVNIRTCGIEWATAPLLLFTHSDRLIFLLNAVSLLLLPGRVFAILTRVGVTPRVAWSWMWLLPTGYGYLTQAGSIGNDLFSATISLLAIECALRARESGNVGDLWASTAAAGLMTGCKILNLVLLLPWAVALLPALRLLRVRPLLHPIVLAAALLASTIPTIALNQRYCGDWTGLAAEQTGTVLKGSRALRLAFNFPVLLVSHFTPPVAPFAGSWNRLMDRTIPPGLAEKLRNNFEGGAARLRMDEVQIEEQAGLGFGLSVLLVVVLVWRLRHLPAGWWRVPSLSTLLQPAVVMPASMWFAALFFLCQTGLNCPGRYLAGFYPLLISPILAGNHGFAATVRSAWFRVAAIIVFLLAAVVVVIMPARPLWPAKTILAALGADHSPRPALKRVWAVYSVYRERADCFAPVRAVLPADADPLGIYMFDYPEGALWKPYGTRRIRHVTSGDTVEQLKAAGIRYVLICSRDFELHYPGGTSIDAWLQKYNAELLLRMPLELRVSAGPNDWYLVKLR
jgi:hypothetical protein